MSNSIENLVLTGSNSDTLKHDNLGLVLKSDFNKTFDFLKSILSEEKYSEFLSYNIITKDIKVSSDGKILSDYFLIDSEEFKKLTFFLKDVMKKDYKILTTEYQFDIIPIEIESIVF
jgi:hypothetical protein